MCVTSGRQKVDTRVLHTVNDPKPKAKAATLPVSLLLITYTSDTTLPTSH